MFSNIRRFWWQITGVLLFNFPFLERLTFAWLPVPVLNCYSCPLAQGACPIGTIQHFFVIGAIPFFAFGVMGVFGMMAGRFYCGHLCPFGFLQDLLARINKRHIRLPRFLDYGKYVSLVLLVIVMPFIVHEPFFCTLCPVGTLEAGIPLVMKDWIDIKFASPDTFMVGMGLINMVGWWFWIKLGLLAALIVGSVFVKRPFCRMACPLGAIFGLFNRISLFVHPPKPGGPGEKIRYNLKNCPVHIVRPEDVDSHSCLKCRECYIHPADATKDNVTA
ncbi:MAG: 4Fe-4S binding protein [Candidatus Latescibacteria bacterium]|nr:4Fe-4S binding protein [Candidatus Latescibacterota bacterium]